MKIVYLDEESDLTPEMFESILKWKRRCFPADEIVAVQCDLSVGQVSVVDEPVICG